MAADGREAERARASEATSVTMRAGAQAAALATAVALAGHAAATRLFAGYRAFGAQPKTFFLTSFVVACFAIRAEQAQLAYIDSVRDEVESKRLAEEQRLLGANAVRRHLA